MRTGWAGQAADAFTAELVALVLVGITLSRLDPWVSAATAAAAGLSMGLQRTIATDRGRRLAYLAVSVALLAVWIAQFGAWSAFFGLLGWSIFMLRRLRLVGDERDVEHGPRLIWDLVFLAGGVFLSFQLHPSSDLVLLALGSALVALGLRFTAMHEAEVTRVGALVNQGRQSATRPLWALAAAMTAVLIASVLFPGARDILLEAVGAAALVFLLWRWWREWAAVLAGGLFLAFIVYLARKLARRKKAPQRSQKLGKTGNLHFPHHHLLTQGLAHFDWGLVALAAAAVALGVVLLRSRAQGLDARLIEAGLTVERTRMDSPGGRRGTSPQTPMRDLMRRWLRWEHRRGHRLAGGETARRFTARRGAAANHDDAASFRQAIDAVSQAYEAERYGGATTGDAAVQSLAQRLREAGVFRRR